MDLENSEDRAHAAEVAIEVDCGCQECLWGHLAQTVESAYVVPHADPRDTLRGESRVPLYSLRDQYA